MFDVFLDGIKKILRSRLFPIALIYIALFSIIVGRLFKLQIVEGPTNAQESNFRETKTRELKSTRGNIYDCNGKLLASNVLSYSVTMEDSSQITTNEQRNAVIHKLIQIIEKSGDSLDTYPFYIIQNKNKELEFNVKNDSALTRFKKNAYTFVLEDKKKLTDEIKAATAQDVYDFLKSGKGYEKINSMFDISDDYSVEDTLKIMSIRYALLCNYPKYLQITIASSVNDATVAAIKENSADLPGVEITQQTKRVYNDSLYFANLIGYTGLISSENLETYNKDGDFYEPDDIVGITGIENLYEKYLRGTKGSETVTINTSDKVVGEVEHTDPVAGNDVYLTIDSNLQKSAYKILERKIAGVLLDNIVDGMDYGSKGESAAKIKIPIYEVYYALINNNIIDITKLNGADATTLDKQVYHKYETTRSQVFEQLDSLLSSDNAVTNDHAGDMEEYLNYFFKVLKEKKILLTENIPAKDQTYQDYKDNKISLSKFLFYAISNNYIDLSKLDTGTEFFSAQELYSKLLVSMKELLKDDSDFNKIVYRNLVFTYKLTGTEICLLLFDQGVLKYNEKDINALSNHTVSAFDFMEAKIKSLEITPAMLALTPCSGSLVITDVNNGNILAMVTYPGYDNNKIANKADSSYYAKLLADKSLPMMNRALRGTVAPGSTFKMVTSFAALEEGVIGPSETITDLGIFDKISPPAKCHVYPNTHGSVDLPEALEVSCNYFFYECGYRLSLDSSGTYKPQIGLDKIKKYAALFGLDIKSGLGLGEETPKVSDDDAVRSAIGQGTNLYAPIQLSRYITTLANGGTNYNLNLMGKVVDKNGTVVEQKSPSVYKDLTKINASTWAAVKKGMYSVVNEPKGSVYNLYKGFGVTVAGKTGTSQISTNVPNNALFLSYAPYENPKISVTAVIYNGFTSWNAADLARDIYKLYFKLQDEKDLVDKEATRPTSNIDGLLE